MIDFDPPRRTSKCYLDGPWTVDVGIYRSQEQTIWDMGNVLSIEWPSNRPTALEERHMNSLTIRR